MGGMRMNSIETRQILQQYGLNGQNTLVRDIVRVDTDKGIKLIKKINFSDERVLFIHEFKEYLNIKGFKYTDRYSLALDGKPYVSVNGEAFVVTDWIDGRECDFNKAIDIKLATENLAVLHKYSLGFIPAENIKPRSELGNLPEILIKRVKELSKFKKVAQKSSSKVDYLFIKNIDYFIERGLSSLKIINSPVYFGLVEKSEKQKQVCHHDYSYHNVAFNKENNLYILNFDNCCYDISVYDIASFLRKVLGESEWSAEVAWNVINWYDAKNRLDIEQLIAITALLEFPQKFWRISNKYFNSRRSRLEIGYNNKLIQVIEEKDSFNNFLLKFKEYVSFK